jgi:hypothetical protein
MGWIVEAEVRGFCDSIDRTCLREGLRKRVNDGSRVRLLGKGLRAGVMEHGALPHPETGVGQGGVLAPVLAKICLVVRECQDWWVKNCLYLDGEARQAFKIAYHAASNHREFLRPQLDADAARENWKLITDAGEAIVKGVDLPSLGEEEYRQVSLPDSENG